MILLYHGTQCSATCVVRVLSFHSFMYFFFFSFYFVFFRSIFFLSFFKTMCSNNTSILIAIFVCIFAYAYGPGFPASQKELTSSYSNQKVVVCGSSYGIGAEIAKDLAKVGWICSTTLKQLLLTRTNTTLSSFLLYYYLVSIVIVFTVIFFIILTTLENDQKRRN